MTARVKGTKKAFWKNVLQIQCLTLLGVSTALLPILSQGRAFAVDPPIAAESSGDLVSKLEVTSPTSLWQNLPPLGDPSLYLPEVEGNVRLVLRLGERRVYVYQGETAIASYPVAVGKASTPTPTGEYEVFQMIENPVWQSPWTGKVTAPGPNSALGLRWIGFAQMSNGIIGFHGTPTVSSIGRAASNGCVRMRNEDVLALFDQVEMGTPVTVEN